MGLGTWFIVSVNEDKLHALKFATGIRIGNRDTFLHWLTHGEDLRSSAGAQGLAAGSRSGGDQDQGAERFQVIRNFRHRDYARVSVSPYRRRIHIS